MFTQISCSESANEAKGKLRLPFLSYWGNHYGELIRIAVLENSFDGEFSFSECELHLANQFPSVGTASGRARVQISEGAAP